MKLNRFGKHYLKFFKEAHDHNADSVFISSQPPVYQRKNANYYPVQYCAITKKLLRDAKITLDCKRYLPRKRKCNPNFPVTSFYVNIINQNVKVRLMTPPKIEFILNGTEHMMFLDDIYQRDADHRSVSNQTVYDEETTDFKTLDEAEIFQYNTLFDYNTVRTILELHENLKSVSTIAQLYQAIIKLKVPK